MISNNGLSQPNPYSDSSNNLYRTRAASASSSPGAPVISHYSAFPQPYQSIGPMESPWNHQQGVYVNGLGKVMNVFPSGTVSELEDLMLGQAVEPYKYAQGMKIPAVGQQSTGPLFQRSSDLAGGGHSTMPTQLQVAIAAAAPGASQSQSCVQQVANSLRIEPSNMLHSSAPHHQISNPAHSLLVPGLVGQHNVQHHQGINSSTLTDSTGLSTNMHSAASYNLKQISPLNGLNNARVIPNHLSGTQTPLASQPCAQGLSVVQHPTASHQHQLYSTSNLQQPTPPPTHLPPPVVEFLPPMYAADPNSQVQFNQTSNAVFGQYASYLPATYENANMPVDVSFNARVRHNTWSGLESGLPMGTMDHHDKVQAAGHLTGGLNRTIPQRGYTFDALGSNFPSCSVYSSNPATSIFSSNVHRPSIVELPVSLGLNSGSTQPHRDVCSFSCSSPHFFKANKSQLRGNSRPQWNIGIVRQPTPWTLQSMESLPNVSKVVNTDSAVDSSVSSTLPVQRRAPQHDQAGRNSRRNRDVGSFGGAEQQQIVTPRQPSEGGLSKARYPHTSVNHNAKSYGYLSCPHPFNARPSLNESNGARIQDRISVCNTTNFYTSSPRYNLQPGSSLNVSSCKTLAPGHNLWRHQPLPVAVSHSDLESGEHRRQRTLPHPLRYFDPPGNFCLPRFSDSMLNNTPNANGLRCLLDALPTRILISTAMVGAVIGKGGRTIRSITSKTGAKIDFKSENVVFSQFSHPTGLRQPSKPPRLSDQSTSDQVTNVNPESLDRATSPPPSPAPANNLQLNRSQVVFLTGPREQCSAAIAEMLAVCFRECEHKGLADPCLGLLIQQQLYTRSLIGRKFFNSVNASTGARVAVTGSPVQIHMGNCESESTSSSKKQPTEPNLDRILVIRGQLSAIIDAEAYISEHVRLHTAKLLVPPAIWPLFPHLPVNALIPSALRLKSSDDWQCDLSTVNSLILSIAEVFWPHSVSSKLFKHYVPIHQNSAYDTVPLDKEDSAATKSNMSKSTSDSNTVQEAASSVDDANLVSTSTSECAKEEEVVETATLTDSPASASPLQETGIVKDIGVTPTSSTNEASSSDDCSHQNAPRQSDMVHAESDAPSQQPVTIQEADSSEQSAVPSHSIRNSPKTPSINDRDLALATAIQQSLVATVSPAAWLATSGVLYMRVSSNEAGLLIGAGGYRIHQLMQSTGAEIHIGKTPISEPYTLSQANRKTRASHPDKTVSSPRVSLDNSLDKGSSSLDPSASSPVAEPVEQHSFSASPSLDSFPTYEPHEIMDPASSVVDSCSIHSSTNKPRHPHTNEPCPSSPGNSTSPFAELIEETPTDGGTSVTAESQTPKATPPSSPDPLKTTVSSHAAANSYRLVTLSGPLQSQLLAQWRIFQRLKALHRKNRTDSADGEFATTDKPECSEKSSCSATASTPFRLATLICLPYRFLCWLTSSNSGFADFMSTNSSPPTLSSTPSTNLLVESSSPLSWLQAQAAQRVQCSTESTPCVIEKAIHILPEPRRRRRLLQLQLRRSGLARRGQSATSFNRHIVLPSVGLAHDGLDLLWADPNRLPLEIYADHETTQIILAHLHHMLALWLYGQALANLTGLGINQALSLYVVPPSLMRPNPLNQHGKLIDPRSLEATAGPPPPSLRSLGDWNPHWLRSPGPLDNLIRFYPAMHPSQMNRFPTHYNRPQRLRMPGFNSKWRVPQNGSPGLHQDFAYLEHMVPATNVRPFATPHSYAMSAFTPFPGCSPHDALLAQTQGLCLTSPDSFPRTGPNLIHQNSGSHFIPSWRPLPPPLQSRFCWDQTSPLIRPTPEAPRRHQPVRPHRKPTTVSESSASNAPKYSVSTTTDKESVVDPSISN